MRSIFRTIRIQSSLRTPVSMEADLRYIFIEKKIPKCQFKSKCGECDRHLCTSSKVFFPVLYYISKNWISYFFRSRVGVQKLIVFYKIYILIYIFQWKCNSNILPWTQEKYILWKLMVLRPIIRIGYPHLKQKLYNLNKQV